MVDTNELKDSELSNNIEQLAGNSGALSNEAAETKEYSDFEQQCIDAGWNPNGAKTADKWALDGLKVRNEKITDLYKITDNLKDMMSKQEQLAMEKAKKELQKERDEAIARGDVQAVRQIEQQESNNAVAVAADKFIARNNEWFNGTSHQHLKMQRAAKEMDLIIKGSSPEDHFAKLDDYMREEFPTYFKPDEELASKKAQAVEGAASPTIKGSKKEFTYNDLTEDQKYWANKYEKLGLYTKKQYIDELMKTGALK